VERVIGALDVEQLLDFVEHGPPRDAIGLLPTIRGGGGAAQETLVP
jgi:hypothetical protein